MVLVYSMEIKKNPMEGQSATPKKHGWIQWNAQRMESYAASL